LIAQLAMHRQTSVNRIYDPACGSGSLLLQGKKHFDAHIIEDGFYGQEINHTTYNLARMNMFLHNINYDKFNMQLGNTLIDPHFQDDKPFDAIVSNPPYSVNWIGSDDPTLINDDRFAPAGACAEVEGGFCVCVALFELFIEPGTGGDRLLPWHFLSGRGGSQNQKVSGG
jgi:type I restriction enzyme M protein